MVACSSLRPKWGGAKWRAKQPNVNRRPATRRPDGAPHPGASTGHWAARVRSRAYIPPRIPPEPMPLAAPISPGTGVGNKRIPIAERHSAKTPVPAARWDGRQNRGTAPTGKKKNGRTNEFGADPTRRLRTDPAPDGAILGAPPGRHRNAGASEAQKPLRVYEGGMGRGG